MNELDKNIREALRNEDADLLENFGGEASMFELVLDTFRGRHRWLAMLTCFWSLVFFVLAIISGVQFFQSPDSRTTMLWAIAFLFCMSAVSMLKIWFWMEINKNAIMREIKRLELRVVKLTGRIGQ